MDSGSARLQSPQGGWETWDWWGGGGAAADQPVAEFLDGSSGFTTKLWLRLSGSSGRESSSYLQGQEEQETSSIEKPCRQAPPTFHLPHASSHFLPVNWMPGLASEQGTWNRVLARALDLSEQRCKYSVTVSHWTLQCLHWILAGSRSTRELLQLKIVREKNTRRHLVDGEWTACKVKHWEWLTNIQFDDHWGRCRNKWEKNKLANFDWHSTVNQLINKSINQSIVKLKGTPSRKGTLLFIHTFFCFSLSLSFLSCLFLAPAEFVFFHFSNNYIGVTMTPPQARQRYYIVYSGSSRYIQKGFLFYFILFQNFLFLNIFFSSTVSKWFCHFSEFLRDVLF